MVWYWWCMMSKSEFRPQRMNGKWWNKMQFQYTPYIIQRKHWFRASNGLFDERCFDAIKWKLGLRKLTHACTHASTHFIHIEFQFQIIIHDGTQTVNCMNRYSTPNKQTKENGLLANVCVCGCVFNACVQIYKHHGGLTQSAAMINELNWKSFIGSSMQTVTNCIWRCSHHSV